MRATSPGGPKSTPSTSRHEVMSPFNAAPAPEPRGTAFFRRWLTEWSEDALRPIRSRDGLRASRLARASEDIVRRLGDRTPRSPSPYELEDTVRALASAWSATGSLQDVTGRHLRRAAFAFFYPRNRPQDWLAQDLSLLKAWLQWLGERGRPGTAVALLGEFLTTYPRELPAFEVIRRHLESWLAKDDGPRATRWGERCRRFGLLERDGPERLLRPWWDSDTGFEAYLGEAAPVPGLEASRFVELATERLLTDTEAWLRNGRASATRLTRVFEWLEADSKLRFPQCRLAVATTLLNPFVRQTPKEDLQQAISAFLCRVVGDPRIRRQQWHDVPDQTRNVLLRWLVGASLEDFFRVLDRTAEAHWKYRKAFWSAYLNRGAIDEAWVVLGPEAQRIVRTGFRKTVAAATLRLGLNVSANHSVLLMRIGGLTIAEWSHNGTCRIWLRGNKTAPRLYEQEYVRQELVNGCDWHQRHAGAPQGTWQESVADFIQYQTGISMARSVYMPR
jgi:hypothetical protein